MCGLPALAVRVFVHVLHFLLHTVESREAVLQSYTPGKRSLASSLQTLNLALLLRFADLRL